VKGRALQRGNVPIRRRRGKKKNCKSSVNNKYSRGRGWDTEGVAIDATREKKD
jgi:hypothetical protein